MKTKNIKRFMTVALAATMVMGSTITAFAEDTPGVSEGTGTYEGGEMQYPTLSVTLPTIPAGTYDYIADPNELIEETSAAHYSGATFTGTTGIFFKTGDTTYADTSKALSITNANAQDIDVTIKLEQKTAGSEGIVYSDAATFETTDKDTKIYLAVTDGAASDPQVSALSASAAATLTTTVEGVEANYEAGWTEETGYKYALKEESSLTAWNSCSYNLTGALNKNATWADGLTFPEIKVTWSYAEHQNNSAPSIASASKTNTLVSGTPLVIDVNAGAGDYAATGVKSVVLANGNTIPTARYTYENNAITFDTTFVTNNINAIGSGNSIVVTVTFTCTDGTDRTDTFTFSVN